MTMHNEQNYPRTMLERLQAAIENPPPRDDGDCFRCKCFGCKRTMQDGEPVWRIRARSPGISIMGWPKTKHSIEYFCKDCRSRDDAHSEVACAFCKRPMHDTVFRSCGFQLRHYSCCRRCEMSDTNSRVNAAARERRAAARGPSRQCEVCGEAFETKRSDAKFCSGMCRQKAYRRRALQIPNESLSE
jgi:hypothetical protein